MGRPNLYLIRIHTALSNEDLARVDRRTAEKGRSGFIRKAVRKLLDELEKEPEERDLR